MINTPPTLTPEGNIRLHNQEGALIPLFFEDENGVPRNVTAVVMVFRTEHGFSRTLTNGTAVNEKVLSLAPGEFASFVDGQLEFVVRDETTVQKPVLWQGNLIIEGW